MLTSEALMGLIKAKAAVLTAPLKMRDEVANLSVSDYFDGFSLTDHPPARRLASGLAVPRRGLV
jgi:hypothetical protein